MQKIIISNIMPDTGRHRQQHPCAQGRTRAKQDQAQASAPGQNRIRSVGGATTHGRRNRQVGMAKRANIDAVGGWRVHTADDTPSKQERCDKIQTLQLHVPREHTAQGSCRVEQERDDTSRCSNNGDTTGRKRRYQHRLRVVCPGTHPQEVIPEKLKRNRAIEAKDTLAFKQQVLNVAPSVFPSRLNLRSRTRIRA